ncbi:MAG: beta strand repeat-containing protein [Methyloceanibacter sp.]|uniref:beta strand repeat-containing protein n=1 Tax=Methyloceanibacter sp. TaxID=1965321 RepID=UPI003D6CEC6C
MDAKSLRRQVLLSSTMLVGALTYGGRAYGQVVCLADPAPPNFTCSGASTDQQTINANNATVVTAPSFSVNTGDSIALSITGDGALSYFDEYASNLTAADFALYIRSGGDIGGGNLGSVTVDTDGNLTGGSFGIYARNNGNGALSITTNGDVEGTNSIGIFAQNGDSITPVGTALTVTTGPGTLTNGYVGIVAQNFGTQALTVNANGNVTGDYHAISATNHGTELIVSTGAGTTVTGAVLGIRAVNYGGALEVTANGNVEGTASIGILARNGNSIIPGGTALTVTTGAGTTVTGAADGIYAINYGSGVLTVTANGDVMGTGAASRGIFAQNGDGSTQAGTALTVTTGLGTSVTGGGYGIYAINYGSDALEVTANGDVDGTAFAGILAQNGATGTQAGTDLTVTTGVGTLVTGGTNGIAARNFGSGATSITANGNVEGTASAGIFARNGDGITPVGTDLTVTTGAGTSVTGGTHGIYASNFGSGATSVTANGDVTGNGAAFSGIYAQNGTSMVAGGTDLTVTTGPGTSVTGGTYGILARNYGDGATSVTANGDVYGMATAGIFAQNGSVTPAGTALPSPPASAPRSPAVITALPPATMAAGRPASRPMVMSPAFSATASMR